MLHNAHEIEFYAYRMKNGPDGTRYHAYRRWDRLAMERLKMIAGVE